MLHSRTAPEPRRDDSDAVTPLGVGADPVPHVAFPSLADISSVRGFTDAAAEVSECACPDFCERDHANE